MRGITILILGVATSLMVGCAGAPHQGRQT